MAILVSVIIPTLNRREDLCRCIDSLLTQTLVSIEIIVVDDCSKDDTREFIGINYPDVRLIACFRRYGPSHLRNMGLREAKGKFILFLDSDVILPKPDIVWQMSEYLSSNGDIGTIGGEIPVYLNIMDEARGKRRDFFGKNHNVISKMDKTSGNQMRSCTYLATCNCMVRKDVAFEIGGFDPYYRFGGEDADFGYRILKKGYSNRVCFTVGVFHYRSVLGRYPDETLRYHLTRIRFNMKHYSLRRNLVIGSVDLLNAALFYLLLAPKIIVKKIRRKDLVSENYLGGWYLIMAYLENLKTHGALSILKHANFLTDEEMRQFYRHSGA